MVIIFRIFIILSLSAPLAVWITKDVDHWVKRIGFSPAPMPFVDRLRGTGISDDIFFSARDAKGTLLGMQKMNAKTLQSFGGPHRHKVFFLRTVFLGHHSSNDNLAKIMRHFCPNQRLEIHPHAIQVTFHLGSERGDKLVTKDFSCL